MQKYFNKLLKVLNVLTDFCFKEGDGVFLSVHGQEAKWTKE